MAGWGGKGGGVLTHHPLTEAIEDVFLVVLVVNVNTHTLEASTFQHWERSGQLQPRDVNPLCAFFPLLPLASVACRRMGGIVYDSSSLTLSLSRPLSLSSWHSLTLTPLSLSPSLSVPSLSLSLSRLRSHSASASASVSVAVSVAPSLSLSLPFF